MSEKLGALNEYRLLGRSGLRVSPICLGTMTFGTEWGWGADKEESRKIFNLYTERGGNFIDTANVYTNGTSETFLGEFLEGRRDQFVLATKFTLGMRKGDPNAGGNHRKNIRQSIEASLKRLRTDYIDLYWLHAWEFRAPIDEVLRALDDLVTAGKILYVGFSDTPAWKVAQANTLADLRGWSPIIAYQIEYSLIERTPERDMLPMARELGIGVTPWGPLAAGLLTGKYKRDDPTVDPATRGQQKDRRGLPADKADDRSFDIIEEVLKIAQEEKRTPSQIALNWLIQQPGITSPIIGARKVEQLHDNIGALEFVLSTDHLVRLDEVSRIDLGFPHAFLRKDFIRNIMSGGTKIEERRP